MELQLTSVRARKILIEEKAVKSPATTFRFRVGYPLEKNVFSVEFNFTLDNEEEDYSLETNYEAVFTTDEEIDDNFRKSSFPNVNAPAIAFPYFRAFISTITQQAGYNPVVLPSLNFVKLAEEMMLEGSDRSK